MRRKPGILAYLAPPPEFSPLNGVVVTVTRLVMEDMIRMPLGPAPFWEVESPALLELVGVSPGGGWACSDSWLRPITGLPDHEVAERAEPKPAARRARLIVSRNADGQVVAR